MRHHFTKTPLSYGIACLIGLTASGAAHQAVAQAAVLDTVVVTSQKRLQLLKDVPMAVSAYRGEQLDELGINSATDLRLVSPSLTFSQSANVRGEGFQIRGVGTSIFSDAIEQSVGFVVDGVVMARSGQASGDMLDVERVEILRGPQGMLFGKNASAGLVSVITKKPRFGENTFDGKLSFANPLNEIKTQLTGNVAVGDKAALRVAFSSTTADGYVNNIVRNEQQNNRDEQLLRVKGLFQPTEQLEIYLIGDAGKKRTLCCAWTARSAPATSSFGRLNAAAGIVPSPTNETIASNSQFFQNSDTSGLSAEVNYDLGWATLTSLTAARTWKTSDNNDPDLLPINVLDINSGISNLRQTSQELRLTSPSGTNLEWVAGLFAYRQNNHSITEQTGNFGGAFGAAVPPGSNTGAVYDTTTKNSSNAIFGQASLRLAPKFKLIAGARYTDETIDVTQLTTPSTAIKRPGLFYGNVVGTNGSNNLSYRLTLQMDATKDDMFYVTTARGFKGPSINTLGVTSSAPELIRPEIPNTVEAGLRSALFGGTTALNAAIFKTRFKDFQAQVYDQNVVPGRFLVTNAGSLDTQGFEFDVTARPIRALTLNASAAYIDAKYGEFNNIACYTGQAILPKGTVRSSNRECILNAAGQALTNGTGNPLTAAPKVTYNLGARFDTNISRFKAYAQANWNWRDKTSYSSAGDPNLIGEAYGLLGGSLGLASTDGSWQATFFVKNMLDKHYVSNLISQPVLNAPGVYSQFTSPDSRRTVGITLSMRIGK